MKRKITRVNIWQEIAMFLLMLVLIGGYITYDFMHAMPSYYAYLLLGFFIGTFLLIFRSVIRNMQWAFIGETIPKTAFTIKRNHTYVILLNMAISLSAGVHFYLYYVQELSFTHLIWEYGIGGTFATGVRILQNRNNQLVLSDNGLIIGSKLDMKLIEWKDIQHLVENTNSFSIMFSKDFPIHSIDLTKSQRTLQAKNWIKAHLPTL
jgi:hypothetical protein